MFRFKQFTIQQDRSAMKVCTDACVLGAYADVAVTTKTPVRLLDIGTGTGLLALMAAQRNPLATVDAVEMDDAASIQAAENVAASPFTDRVRVIPGRIQDFMPPTPFSWEEGFYDRILTNPPFYTDHLRSPDPTLNRALHTDELPFGELIAAVARLLKPGGQWWVLLPPYEMDKLAELAQTVELRPFRRLQLRHNDRKPSFRIVTGFAFEAHNITNETLNIYESDGGAYTTAFRTLLNDFYLIF